MSSVAATPSGSVEAGEVAGVAADLVRGVDDDGRQLEPGLASTARIAARPTFPVPHTTVATCGSASSSPGSSIAGR